MRRLLLAIIASTLLSLPAAFFAAAPLNSSQSEANSTFNSALGYVGMVNQSGYLFFYPNLTAAYADLNKSMGMISSSPQQSLYYASEARQNAMLQYEKLSSYRYYSAIAMAAFTVAIGAMLYFYMQPVKALHGSRGRRR